MTDTCTLSSEEQARLRAMAEREDRKRRRKGEGIRLSYLAVTVRAACARRGLVVRKRIEDRDARFDARD